MENETETTFWKGRPSQWLNIGPFTVAILLAAGIIAGGIFFPPAFIGLVIPLIYMHLALSHSPLPDLRAHHRAPSHHHRGDQPKHRRGGTIPGQGHPRGTEMVDAPHRPRKRPSRNIRPLPPARSISAPSAIASDSAKNSEKRSKPCVTENASAKWTSTRPAIPRDSRAWAAWDKAGSTEPD